MNARYGLVAFLMIVAVSSAEGQTVRTWVSTNGDDANPCTRSLPCRTFGAAIAAVDAGGEVVVLDSGGFSAATVNKDVTIVAPEGIHAALAPTSGTALTIGLGATVVVIRNLYFNSQGATTGISKTLSAEVKLHVDGCVFDGFGTHGILASALASVFVSDSVFRRSGSRAIDVQNTGPATSRLVVNRCSFEDNQQGVTIFRNATAAVRDSIFSGNTLWGVLVNDTGFGPTEMVVENCLFVGNGDAIRTEDVDSHIDVSGSTIVFNTTGVNPSPGTINSRENNTLRRNVTDGTFSSTFLPQ